MMSLAVVFAVVSCNKGNLPEQTRPGDDDDPYANEEKVSLTVEGVHAEYDGVAFAQDWKTDDAIGVYATGEGAPVRFKAGEISESGASFTGKVKKADSYTAVYPYSRDYAIKDGAFTVTVPSSQDVAAGSIEKTGFVAYGEVKDGKVAFLHILSLLKFTVKAENVRSVKVASKTDGSFIAGGVTVSVSDLAATVKEAAGETSVTLNSDFVSGTSYYAVVLPGKYSLELTFTNAAGKQVVKSVDAEAETARGAVLDLGVFEITDSEWNAGGEEPVDPSKPKSYVLNGKAEVEAFAAGKGEEKETVQDLTIKGRDVSHEVARKIMERVAAVEGTFTLEGCGTDNEGDWFDTEGFLNGFELKGGLVFRDIVNIVNPSALKYYEKINGDLVIEDCPNFVLADWSMPFETIGEVSGNLVIKGCHPKANGAFLKSLKRVGGNFDFEDNTGFWSFKDKGEIALEYIGGDLILANNESLWSLIGFDRLTHIGGNVVVFNNNPKFPTKNQNVDGEDCIGYCLLKDYSVSGVLSPTATIRLGSDSAPVDFASLKGCDAGEDPQPGEPQDYVLVGHDAVRAFVDAHGATKETVRNLTISGSDVTENDVRDLDDRVGRITGKLTLENLGTSDDESWISTNEVMEYISIEGGITLKNIPAGINPNGFENLTKINGDLKVINCPRLRCSGGWMPFKNLTEVTGDVLISGQTEFGKDFLNKLEKVGGSFTIDKCNPSCWDWKSGTLREIGGDLNITDCTYWENFYGFHRLTRLGGNVNVYKSEGYAQDGNGNDKWLPGTDWDLSGKKVGLVLFTVLNKKGIFTGEFSSYLWRADGKGGTFWYDALKWEEYTKKADEIITAE